MVPYSWLIEIEIVNKRISEKKKKYCKSKSNSSSQKMKNLEGNLV